MQRASRAPACVSLHPSPSVLQLAAWKNFSANEAERATKGQTSNPVLRSKESAHDLPTEGENTANPS